MKHIRLFSLLIATVLLVFCLTGCNEEEKKKANEAAESYNSQVEEYNKGIRLYNDAVDKIVEANNSFNAVIDAAQASIDKGEKPYDENTETKLKNGIVAANKKVVAVPKKLDEKGSATVDEAWDKGKLEEFISDTNEDTSALASETVPTPPEIPNYETEINELNGLKKAYEDSIQGLKQITAPTDEFVTKRLQRIDTILSMAAVTEDHDPNGKLNKQGGYIACIYFRDSRVDKKDITNTEAGDDVIEIGTEGGGAVEVFKTEEEAVARDNYLAMTQSISGTARSHYVRGTCVIRTSEHLKGSEQMSLTDAITNALIAVDN